MGDSFNRESSVIRDLGVLSASPLHLMCGCGILSLRYLSHAGTAFVWGNDDNEDHGNLITNLSRATPTDEVEVEMGGRRN
ncbi:hypothetical protein QJS10_CPB14g01106 [Acorus calamus]|uniref:Uncharacterized protein n=1 Tax=Acorus calamus TaxID=4465 RepID=A0AAV9D9S8_ACOCL|nr:hypothetical protein QJS10_CPB14g01106 [Acorus calamus]